jgi:uncharacterized membrane protein
MNPFDVRSALLARHAQHVVIVHFPIALSIMSWLFDLLALRQRKPTLAAAAYYNLVAAALLSIPAIATGLTAWQLQLGGARLRGNLRLHLVVAIIGSAMLWILWRLRRQYRRAAQPPGAAYFALAAVAAAAIALTGHLGGFVSGVEGAGF